MLVNILNYFSVCFCRVTTRLLKPGKIWNFLTLNKKNPGKKGMPQIFCLLSGARKTLKNLWGAGEEPGILSVRKSEAPSFCSVFFFLFNIIYMNIFAV